MVLSIVERIKGFLFSPSETFDASKEDTLGDAFIYFVVMLAIYAVLIAIITAGAYSLIGGMPGMFGAPVMPWGAAMGPLLGVLFFVYVLVGGIIGVFILGLWLHLWVYLFGGRNGLIQTIKAVVYGETPGLVLGWIPIINIIAAIWSIIVSVIGVRQLHGLSTGKAVIAVILALLIPAIIIGALIAYLMPMMPVPPMGPGFGGY